MSRQSRQGPPVFFSICNPRNEVKDSVKLRVIHPLSADMPDAHMEMVATVNVAGRPGAGFIHIHPTVEQIDTLIASLLELRQHLQSQK